jgi:SAM-dependent methyltransferase
MTDRSTERFSDRVADYVRYRPRYPAAVVDVLRDALGLAPDWVIADVGSGTGFSAQPFLARGHTVYGIEPNGPMRAAAEEVFADHARFRSVAGTAESTTLPDASVDLAVAGQAFHWFEPAASRRELMRILRGEAPTALLWNTRRTDGAPFLCAYEDLLLKYGTDYAAVRHDRLDPDRLARFFGGPYDRRVLHNEQVLDLEALSGRLRSSSYVPAPGRPGHDDMMRELRAIFGEHARAGAVALVYDLEVYTGRLRPRAPHLSAEAGAPPGTAHTTD